MISGRLIDRGPTRGERSQAHLFIVGCYPNASRTSFLSGLRIPARGNTWHVLNAPDYGYMGPALTTQPGGMIEDNIVYWTT